MPSRAEYPETATNGPYAGKLLKFVTFTMKLKWNNQEVLNTGLIH
jgi:hypothetical protein